MEHKSNFSVMNDCLGSVPNEIPGALLNTALDYKQDKRHYPHESAITKLEPLWNPKARSASRLGMFRHREERATINTA